MRSRTSLRMTLGRGLVVAVMVAAGLASVVGVAGPAQAASGTYQCNQPSYACTTGGYSAASAQSSGWPWSYYGGKIPSYNSYGPHNCTLYAAWTLQQNGVNLNWSANARDWATYAAARAVPVNNTAAVGAIAQWNSGHVAYVEQVGNGFIITTDDNYSYNNTSRQLRTPASGWPDHFIHFKDIGTGIAFQANTGNLWAVGAAGSGDLKLGMMKGTSPSIAAVSGGYEIAFQANTGNLWAVGAAGSGDLKLGMMAGSSPTIC